jgi:aryl-phospho-beta-D-glucosidase BglC (GH1 family)
MVCCCGKSGGEAGGSDPVPTPPASISLSINSVNAPAESVQQDVIVTAPARPRVEIPQEAKKWISYSDGIYKDFQLTVTLKIAANTSYEAREAELVVSATGVPSVKLTVSQAAREVVKDPELPSNEAVARTRWLGLGWNMGNQLDAINNGVANETCWGNQAATQATFDGVKAAGFTSVRIPVTWQGHIGEAPGYLIEKAWMDRVYEVVGYAEKAGLNVILNTHHDEDHGDGHWQNLKGAVDSDAINTRVKEEIAAVWGQIAERFKDKGDFLVLESFNELIYGDQWSSTTNTQKKCDVINEWNQVFVNAVRATGGNNATRWLGVPGYAASPAYLKYLSVPSDPAKRTMLAFHCYDPYDYTIGKRQLPDWGHTGSSYPNGEEELKTLFNSIYTQYIAKNIPVYMGEFGCSFRDKKDSMQWAFFLYYLEYVVKCAKTFGIAGFLWDNGGNDSPGAEHHCYINHGTGQYYSNGKEPVDVMVKACFTDDEKYTLQSVYDSAPVL